MRAVDAWSAETGYRDIFAQIGEEGAKDYTPENFDWCASLDANAYAQISDKAQIFIAHAGTGSVITALSQSKPIVIMPRKAALGEHRNDHQLATADRFREKPGVWVADDETVLGAVIEKAFKGLETKDLAPLSPFADDFLIKTIQNFISQ